MEIEVKLPAERHIRLRAIYEQRKHVIVLDYEKKPVKDKTPIRGDPDLIYHKQRHAIQIE